MVSLSRKKRYALCGLSTRGIYHFLIPLLGHFPDGNSEGLEADAEVVSILDIDEARVARFFERAEIPPIPFYHADRIDTAIRETKPDVLLIAGPDFTHCEQIIIGLNHDLDVIVEKPLCIDGEQAKRIRKAELASKGRVIVAFNMRYSPLLRTLKKKILDGNVGRVTNIEFVYNLDTSHGTSYFYRWNRERAKSGGLTIHKGSHHFDFIHWLFDTEPRQIFAYGALNYYGSNGAHRPRGKNGAPLDPVATKASCPYFQRHYGGRVKPEETHFTPGWDTYKIGYDVQYDPNKHRYIYDSEIDIEDTYSAVIRYANGASMTYSCNFSTPWEGFVLGINGTEGRLEVSHRSEPDPTGQTKPASENEKIIYYPLFGGREETIVSTPIGGHGGADPLIRRDLFVAPSEESQTLKLIAGTHDGAMAVAVGEGIWRSIAENRPLSIEELLGDDWPLHSNTTKLAPI